jgi:hypothetical protein
LSPPEHYLPLIPLESVWRIFLSMNVDFRIGHIRREPETDLRAEALTRNWCHLRSAHEAPYDCGRYAEFDIDWQNLPDNLLKETGLGSDLTFTGINKYGDFIGCVPHQPGFLWTGGLFLRVPAKIPEPKKRVRRR